MQQDEGSKGNFLLFSVNIVYFSVRFIYFIER